MFYLKSKLQRLIEIGIVIAWKLEIDVVLWSFEI